MDGGGPAARGWQGTPEREDDALRGARGARTTCEPREGPWFDTRMCFRGSAAWLRLEGTGSRGGRGALGGGWLLCREAEYTRTCGCTALS